MIKRLFIPGSEWLFFKLYTGNKTGDNVLIDYILPLTEEILRRQLADKWFFIRYQDPEFHLRVRFHIPEPENYGSIFPILYETFNELTEKNHVYKIQCDSYNRELERYGEQAMELTETWFYKDSQYILKILEVLRTASDPYKARWCAALRLIDDILNAFEFTPISKRDFMLEQSEGFKKEFGYTDIPLIRKLNNKYRENRKDIENVFAGPDSAGAVIFSGNNLIKERAGILKNIGNEILSKDSFHTNNRDNYIASLIHMTMNRVFHSSNRMYEMVIYDFLYRYYKSCVAREGKES